MEGEEEEEEEELDVFRLIGSDVSSDDSDDYEDVTEETGRRASVESTVTRNRSPAEKTSDGDSDECVLEYKSSFEIEENTTWASSLHLPDASIASLPFAEGMRKLLHQFRRVTPAHVFLKNMKAESHFATVEFQNAFVKYVLRDSVVLSYPGPSTYAKTVMSRYVEEIDQLRKEVSEDLLGELIKTNKIIRCDSEEQEGVQDDGDGGKTVVYGSPKVDDIPARFGHARGHIRRCRRSRHPFKGIPTFYKTVHLLPQSRMLTSHATSTKELRPEVDVTLRCSNAFQNSTGSKVWKAGHLLARFLATGDNLFGVSFEKRTVLEIGSGCGIAGIALVAAHRPKHVIFTDISTDALQLCEENIRINFNHSSSSYPPAALPVVKKDTRASRTRVSVRRFDWSHPETFLSDCPHIDVVIGADVAYADTVPPLVKAMTSLLSKFPNVEIIIACTERMPETWQLFCRTTTDRGLAFRILAEENEFLTTTSGDEPRASVRVRILRVTSKANAHTRMQREHSGK
eukprot:g366.t1